MLSAKLLTIIIFAIVVSELQLEWTAYTPGVSCK